MKAPRHLIAAVLLLALLGGAVWLWQATEWYEQTAKLQPQGAAADNRLYAVQKLAVQLGLQVQAPLNLDLLPPPAATLLLTSQHWNLLPQRAARLAQWVRAGGHLVVLSHDLNDKGALNWVPLRQDFSESEARRLAELRESRPRGRGQADPDEHCQDMPEAPSQAAAFAPRHSYRACVYGARYLRASAPLLWSVNSPAGPVAATVAVEQGRVTALVDWSFIANQGLTRADHGLLLAAALQLHAGRTLWLVADEQRPSLAAWLWQHAAPVLLLGAAAGIAALWRAAARFGPPLALPDAARRSISHQVQGTSRFLWQHGAAALLAAQRRALVQAVSRRQPQWPQWSLEEQARALARGSRASAVQWLNVLQPRGPLSAAQGLAALRLMEITRRQWRAAPASPSSTESPP